jgi:hypothetical protein
LSCHGDLFSSVAWIIREGYAGRNPADPDFLRRLTASYHQALDGQIAPLTETGCSTAPCIGLFGLSGIGKTTALERTLSFFPQVLMHATYGFAQVVWLKLDCPPDGSLKQLLLSILEQLDQLLESKYVAAAGGATADELILMVGKIARMHHVGALVIDEIQHLVITQPQSRKKLLNFLVNLSNVVRVPVVVVGTLSAKSVLEPSFKFARRFSDSGAFVWDRLEGDEWDFFVDGLLQFQWTHKFAKRSDIAAALFEETQGVHALTVRLFQLCQIEAIKSGAELLTPALIRRVAGCKFKLLDHAIKSLRTGSKYNDFDVDFEDGINCLDVEIESQIRSPPVAQSKGKTKSNSQRNRAISTLIVLLDLDDGATEALVDDILALQPNLKAMEIVQAAAAAYRTGEPGGTGNVVTMADILSSSDQPTTVDALRASGVIRGNQSNGRDLSPETV